MNLPNQLTVARLFLTAGFVASCAFAWPYAWSLALLLFIVAAITDYYDGKIARERGLITSFGKLMDPLADKVLMAAAFVVLCAEDLIPAWVVVAILFREFLVTGLRTLAISANKVLAADRYGKLKTVMQIVAVIYLLLYLASREPLFAWMGGLFEPVALSPAIAGRALVGVALFLTLMSGWNYLWGNRELLTAE